MNRFDRLNDLIELYRLLDILEAKIGGKRTLGNLSWISDIPLKGVYFLFEPGEYRTDSGTGNRVVRVGTHGLKTGSNSTLRGRLRQHRGNIGGKAPGGGNHRGSVFRKHVGQALINLNHYPSESSNHWGLGPNASVHVRDLEYPIEIDVSDYLRNMNFFWIEVDDSPGPNSLRGYIERNSIALLSNFEREMIDKPSETWLGYQTKSEMIMRSGLWNVNHVSDEYNSEFLKIFLKIIES